jgi:hypothetical protein
MGNEAGRGPVAGCHLAARSIINQRPRAFPGARALLNFIATQFSTAIHEAAHTVVRHVRGPWCGVPPQRWRRENSIWPAGCAFLTFSPISTNRRTATEASGNSSTQKSLPGERRAVTGIEGREAALLGRLRDIGQKVHTLGAAQALLLPSLTLLVGSRDECKATVSAYCFAPCL